MPITMMTRALDGWLDGSVPLPNNVQRVEHSSAGTLFLETTHHGLVLSTHERNGRDDSDFIAVVWNAEKGEPQSIEYASTRGWSYSNHAEVDATPETLAAVAAYRAEQARQTERQRIAHEAKTPCTGKLVRVVSGRKIPVGTEGTVFWFGKAREFGNYPRNGYMAHGAAMHAYAKSLAPYAFDPRDGMRVGLLTASGTKLFTDAKNVEVVHQS